MKKYQNMTKAELIKSLERLEKRPAPAHLAAAHQRVLHELQVHQIELETQNRELREAEQLIEASRDRYADLYDFAPVGCVTLDHAGVIQEINLTGATLLGLERATLIGRPLSHYVVRSDVRAFREHLRRCLGGGGRPTTCELRLAVKTGGFIDAQLQSVPIPGPPRSIRLCRTAISDITGLKRAEDQIKALNEALERRVRERTAELEGANQQLQREIADRHQAEVALQRSSEQLQKLSHRLLTVQENERRILARELHDEIGQTLTFFKLAVDMCLRLPLEQVREKLSEASGKVGKLVDQVRNLSLELRPTLLDDLGLLPALRWLIGRFTANTRIEVDFRHSGLEGCRFATGTETAVYRIVQEGLTNVARHARIQRASVKVWRDSRQLHLQIGDGGCGFEATALTAGTSSGLCGLRERARLAGGQLNIESAPGKGTVITARLSAQASGGRPG